MAGSYAAERQGSLLIARLSRAALKNSSQAMEGANDE